MSKTNYGTARAGFALLATLITAAGAEAQVGKNLGLLDPNLASRQELLTVPGMDAARVDAVIKGRPWLDMLALDKILSPGLSAEQRQAAYRRLWTPLDLNTASKQEILLIPGVGERMLHEFEEYRPYVALAQFRREIGKYVNDEELARLEQYVFVPIDLNTASDQDILSIPGVGDRMLREFKEYRPYRGIEQFRREIGKYVSKDELARLERFVTIK